MGKFKQKQIINDIRLLSLDMINNAKSGHPGIALGCAPIMYTLFTEYLNFDYDKPNWSNRDRFIMSCGHGSSLLYSTLFCVTKDYTINDLKRFRRINSCTPGHPEYDLEHRIEATTGALGQGFATAVGMAMAEKSLEATYNSKDNILFDYDIYCLVSDGDLMEGISYEAASFAGINKLDNLIVLYDSNKITLDSELDDDYQERIMKMFVSLGWKVIEVEDGENVREISKAIASAKKNKFPTLIVVNTTIGKYSKYEGTNKIHSTLDADDLGAIRSKLSGNLAFCFDEANMELYREHIKKRVRNNYSNWYLEYEKYINSHDEKEVEGLNSLLNNEDILLKLENVIDMDKLFTDKSLREVNYQIMNVISAFVPNFIGGSSDVVTSTKTYLKNKDDFNKFNYCGKNINFGVREHLMGAILNGYALTYYRPFGSTFLTFSDYLKPALRNSCIMNLPVTYIFTHDSFTVGQDGTTHQPIEQLGSLRMVPNLEVYRPCDYKELIGSWNNILNNKLPSALVLPRGVSRNYKFTSIDETNYGGYVISEVKNKLDLILLASGTEVALAMKIKEELFNSGVQARVISVPNLKKFLNCDKDYLKQVIPKGYKRIAIEFSNDPLWHQLVESSDDIISINHFGKSGLEEELVRDFELDLASIIIKIKNRL